MPELRVPLPRLRPLVLLASSAPTRHAFPPPVWWTVVPVTVDNYQGEESDVIVGSFVRSNEGGQMGFVGDPNRLNVAISRARYCTCMAPAAFCARCASKLKYSLFSSVELLDLNVFFFPVPE